MGSAIRILCVFSMLDRGGAETMCMNLYRHMDRDLVQFDFIKHTSLHGAYEDEIVALGGKIYEAPKYKVYNQKKYCDWWRRHLKKHPEHKVIHGHMFNIATIYFSVAHEYGCVTIAHSHSKIPIKNEINIKGLIKIILRKKLESESDYCLACSDAAGKFMFPHRQYTILKNAIDVEQYRYNEDVRTQMRLEFNIPHNAPVVGVIGSMIEAKNPLGTLRIFHKLKKKIPEAILLWCGDGPLRGNVENRIDKLGIKNDVILAGVRNDIPNILQAMDVYIMPSFYEGLGMATIEAQAAGIHCYLSEMIPKEVSITGLCKFIQLNDINMWIDSIKEGLTQEERVDTIELIQKNGYDIKTTVPWLQSFYLKLEQESSIRKKEKR